MTRQNNSCTKRDSKRLRCGAHSRRTGKPCRAWPVAGSKRCRMHGGKGSGAPEKNKNARTHGLTSKRFRLRMVKHRLELEAMLATAEKAQDARSLTNLAETLQRDARRLLSLLQALEARLDALEAEGPVSEATLDAYLRRLLDVERGLARVRSTQTALIARFPLPDEDEGADTLLTLPPGCNVIVVGGGDRPAITEGDSEVDEP